MKRSIIRVKGNILVDSTTLAVSATEQKLSVTNISTDFTHSVLHKHKNVCCHPVINRTSNSLKTMFRRNPHVCWKDYLSRWVSHQLITTQSLALDCLQTAAAEGSNTSQQWQRRREESIAFDYYSNRPKCESLPDWGQEHKNRRKQQCPLTNLAARREQSRRGRCPGQEMVPHFRGARYIASQSEAVAQEIARWREESSSIHTIFTGRSPPPCHSKKREGNASAGLSSSSDRSQSRNLQEAAGVSAGRRAARACARA